MPASTQTQQGKRRTEKMIAPGTNHFAMSSGGTRSAGVMLLLLFVSVCAIPTVANAQTGTDGIMVLKNSTAPRGGVWLNGSLGGHWWQPDQVLGICRVDSAPGATPPWTTSNCQGAAKAAGQTVVATPGANIAGLPAGARFVFVADSSSKSVAVVRFVFNPATETLSGALTMQVPNPTFVGGGSGGGRPVALALAPNGVDLYVGYLKSGDIMKITGATTTTSGSPVVSKIGTTSDSKGVNTLLLFNSDLYLAEIGGNGLSTIPDPAGLRRAACAPASPCRGVSISPQMSFFPGGLATDNTFIYIGDSPLTTPGRILQWNPATGAVVTYSINVPQYTASFDNGTRNQYVNPYGLGLMPNGDLMVSDDPAAALVVAVVPTTQGHLWRVPAAAVGLSVTSVAPNSGTTAGGDAITVSGTGFATNGGTDITIGPNRATNIACATTTSCTANTPAGSGTVDIRVTVNGAQSPATAADLFAYNAPPPPAGGPVVTSISPSIGLNGGGTTVTIRGSNFAGVNPTTITFGPNVATGVTCVAAGTSCTAISPAGTGTVDVQVTVDGATSASVAADRFTYGSAVANLFAWGITAPKGGMLFLPGNLGGGPGHFWSSDHSAGFCRQDSVPGTTLHAINYSACDDGTIGSPGQAVYDPRVNPDGNHYVYVPDNAVKSTAVWRLTYNPSTETIVGAPEAMIPLADVRTLKPNGMALGPDGNLYVTDLTEANIRQITNPNGDPRTQTVGIVAVTGDGRGANGTIGFIGNRVYISENRAAAWFDVTTCSPNAAAPCNTNPIPLPSGVFVAGVATDPVNGFVYAADSPGGANANIWRYNVNTGVTALYLQGGAVPTAGSPNATVYCALTCTRPFDSNLIPGGTAGFAFAFGLYVDTTNGSLYITEDPTAGARGGHGRAWVTPLVP
jgi:hypothetical protein